MLSVIIIIIIIIIIGQLIWCYQLQKRVSVSRKHQQ